MTVVLFISTRQTFVLVSQPGPYTGCLKKKGEAVQSDFSYSICEAMIKVRYVLNSSFNGEHFKRLNFSIWSILTPSTAKIPRAIGNEDLHQKRHDFIIHID